MNMQGPAQKKMILSKRDFLAISLTLFITALAIFAVLPRMTRLSNRQDTARADEGPLYTVGFADGYDLIGKNLANGKGFRFEPYTSETMMREPGYPLVLAVAFKVAGDKLSSAQWLNWLLTIGIAFMMVRLAWIVTHDRSAAVIAAVIALLYPSTVIAEARGGVEILFIFVVLTFILVLYKAISESSWWWFLLAGLALGVVVQVRSTPIVFPPFLLTYLIISSKTWRLRLRAAFNVLVLCAGMVLMIVPWLVRNFELVHHLVPTATVQGVAMQEGQYTCDRLAGGGDFYALQREAGLQRAALAESMHLPFEGAYYYQFFFNAKDEWLFNQELLHRAKTAYLEHPGFLAYCTCKNVYNFWFLGKTAHSTRINEIVQTPFLLLAVAGLYLLWKRGQFRRMWVMLVFGSCIMGVSLPIIAHARHSVPLVPFLAIPGAVAIVSIWQWSKRFIEHRTRQVMAETAGSVRGGS